MNQKEDGFTRKWYCSYKYFGNSSSVDAMHLFHPEMLNMFILS
jgi:hypothetical protein